MIDTTTAPPGAAFQTGGEASATCGVGESTTPNETPYITSRETAAICRVSENTVRWWRHVGRGPRAVVLPGGRRVLYRHSDVLAWIESGLEPALTDER